MRKINPVIAAALFGSLTLPALASSHREAPAITEDPTVDCTDVYSFVSPDRPDTVTVIANYIPLQEPSGGPNYYKFSDTALYEIHVDNDGDAIEDVTFQFRFTTTTKNDRTFLYNTGPITVAAGGDDYDGLNVVQRYTLTRVDGDRRRGTKTVIAQGLLVAPTNVGPKSIPDYGVLAQEAIHQLPGGITAFAGPRDDPFFINLGRTFDLINVDPFLATGLETGGPDHLAGFNCSTIALQIPMSLITADGSTPTDASNPNSIVGIWSTASRRQVRLTRVGGKEPVVGGAWVQVSRLGMPLVNEVVIPRKDKDVFNNAQPKDDGQFLDYVVNPEMGAILDLLFGTNGLNPIGLPVAPAPRNDLVTAFLTGVPGLTEKGTPCEYQRLNLAIPPTPVADRDRLGVLAGQLDGFPNGRRLEDDVVDIALRVVQGVLVDGATYNTPLGDLCPANDKPFLATFPYLAAPHDGVTRQHQ
jgi:hypothetical protein